jgi:uncharacterized protein YjhX (UPF0386 family)
VVGLRHWGEAHLYAKGERHSVLLERDSGKPVPKIDLRTRDGKPLDPDLTFVKKLPARTATATTATKAGSR